MKQFSTLLIVLLALNSCTKKQTATISGKVSNAFQDYVTLYMLHKWEKDTIALNPKDNTFSLKVNMEGEHNALLNIGGYGITLCLQPGANIYVKLDVEDFKNTDGVNTKIIGEGNENSVFKLLLDTKNLRFDKDFRTIPIDSLKTIAENHYNSIIEEIEKYEQEKNPSNSFIDRLKFEQKIRLAKSYKYYLKYHKQNDPQPLIIEDLNTFVESIPLNNFDYYQEITEYRTFVTAQAQNKIREKIAKQGIDRWAVAGFNAYFDEIATLDIHQRAKDELGYRLVSRYRHYPDSIKRVIKKSYTGVIKNPTYLADFKKNFATIDALKPGTIAPGFEYNDIDGNLVTSESLKGKVIYIDVWATWCGPCKAEIPHLQKLEKELHNKDIVFVCISVDRDKAEWEKMVKEKEMGGYQLFAPKERHSKIVKDYGIRGVPYFIMIDKEGKLIKANASRPSNPKTKEKLLELTNS